MTPARLGVDELEKLLHGDFPEVFHSGNGLSILSVSGRSARVRLSPNGKSTRPGGTISGPTLMMLADVTMYVGVLAAIGWVPLAVTTNFNINFLRKPAPGALVADCRLLKVGKRLAVGDVIIRSEGEDDAVAHATLTYSIPA